jgi:SAM-dependent methyltransferase
MRPKVRAAAQRGVKLIPEFIGPDTGRFDFVSAINVFSHVNEPRQFLSQLQGLLKPRGELILETGDMSRVDRREDYPGELDLPDHVGFATRQNVHSMLQDAGFELVGTHYRRVDGLSRFSRDLAKRLLGRQVSFRIPYSSPFRSMLVRARQP